MNSGPRHMAAVQRSIAAIIVVGFVVAIGVFVLVNGRGSSSSGGGSPSAASSPVASSAAAISSLADAAAPSPGATASAASGPTPAATKSAATKPAAKSGAGTVQAPSAPRSAASTLQSSSQKSTPKPKPTKTKTSSSSSLASQVRSSVGKAVSYFRANQLTSGGFGASGQTTTTTPWVVQAIAATGKSPSTFRRSGGKGPIAYLQSLDITEVATGGSGTASNPANFYAKMIITYDAAGVSSLISTAGSGHIDLVAHLLAYENSQSGVFSTTPGGSDTYAAVSTTAWAVIALRAAGQSSSQLTKSVSWLTSQQASNGGFSFTPGGAPDPDDTAAAVEALRSGGISASNTAIERALSYLHSQQMSNGGFTSGMGGTTNAESTAWAVQAIRAVGQNPAGGAWKKGGKTPISFLLSLQASSGAFYHYGTTLAMPLLTTSEVVVALSGKTYPF